MVHLKFIAKNVSELYFEHVNRSNISRSSQLPTFYNSFILKPHFSISTDIAFAFA